MFLPSYPTRHPPPGFPHPPIPPGFFKHPRMEDMRVPFNMMIPCPVSQCNVNPVNSAMHPRISQLHPANRLQNPNNRLPNPVISDFHPGNRLHNPNNYLQNPNNCMQNPNNCLQNPNNCLQNPNNLLPNSGIRLPMPGNRLQMPGNCLPNPGNRLPSYPIITNFPSGNRLPNPLYTSPSIVTNIITSLQNTSPPPLTIINSPGLESECNTSLPCSITNVRSLKVPTPNIRLNSIVESIDICDDDLVIHGDKN